MSETANAQAPAPVPMTQEEYLEHSGTQCPMCRCSELEAGHPEVDCTSAWTKTTCLTCGVSFREVFILAFYELEDRA